MIFAAPRRNFAIPHSKGRGAISAEPRSPLSATYSAGWGRAKMRRHLTTPHDTYRLQTVGNWFTEGYDVASYKRRTRAGGATSRRRRIELPDVEPKAPIPSAAIVGNVLASSAVFGADPTNGEMPAAVGDEVANVFENIHTVLQLAGAASDDVPRTDLLIRESVHRDLSTQISLRCSPTRATWSTP